jgi:poly(3-hydroxybutyrate) depolymerase
VATKWPVDQRRLFVGGISSGGTMTNRALTFRSDFWAGGMPVSGEWYVTRDDGTSWGADDFSARRAAVAADPTKIFQGRVGPFPLKATVDPMIVITVWGGATDLWNCSGVLCADYRPTTQVGSNYWSSMPDVVHVACSTTDGHQWPTINRDAFNLWALTTLSSHPKGTPKASFTLTPPPAGYTCKLGVFTDHY